MIRVRELRALFGLLCALCAPSVVASSLPLFATGEAYAVQNGDLLYRELHFCRDDGLVCEVHYRDQQGGVMATKFLDYQRSSIAPVVVFKDRRVQGERELRPPLDSEHVVDAGFDNFVRSQWRTLLTGGRVQFKFQPLGFDRPFAMRAAVQESGCDPARLCLQVRVDSWLLGLVAKPLNLVYSRDTRQLLRYSGVSNLSNEDGDTPLVDIYYSYP